MSTQVFSTIFTIFLRNLFLGFWSVFFSVLKSIAAVPDVPGGHYKFLYKRITSSNMYMLCLCANYLSKFVFTNEFQDFYAHKFWHQLSNSSNGTQLSGDEMAALDWLMDWRMGGEPYSMEILGSCGAPFCQCARFLP